MSVPGEQKQVYWLKEVRKRASSENGFRQSRLVFEVAFTQMAKYICCFRLFLWV